MVKARILETDHGITGEFTTQLYDKMMRCLRDRGWMETKEIIGGGISTGLALEIGPGPGYLGLEWLKNTVDTRLIGLDISKDMLTLARKNTGDYGLSDRAEYFQGDAGNLPFEDGYFDAVFSNGSLHEWVKPSLILNEISRVLKNGGRYVITDLRRDMSLLLKSFLWISTSPWQMRPGLITSINAAYTPSELPGLLKDTNLTVWQVSSNPLGIVIRGEKKS